MKKNQGFTLIEIMIVVAIVAILASIAYPSYTEHVQRGNRAEGMAFLNDIAARQERYYSQNNTYADELSKLGVSSDLSETGKFKIAIEAASKTAYNLIATQQYGDTKCVTFSLDAKGERKATGSKDKDYCWR